MQYVCVFVIFNNLWGEWGVAKKCITPLESWCLKLVKSYSRGKKLECTDGMHSRWSFRPLVLLLLLLLLLSIYLYLANPHSKVHTRSAPSLYCDRSRALQSWWTLFLRFLQFVHLRQHLPKECHQVIWDVPKFIFNLI